MQIINTDLVGSQVWFKDRDGDTCSGIVRGVYLDEDHDPMLIIENRDAAGYLWVVEIRQVRMQPDD